MVIGKQNPLHEFNKQAVQAFEELVANLENDIVKAFNSASITKDGIDLESEGVKTPSATWTYLLNEDPNQFSNLPFLIEAMSNAVKGPLFTISSLRQSIKSKIKSLR
jgi:preprotein translocase subunit SecA